MARTGGKREVLHCFPLLLAHLANGFAGLVAGIAVAKHRKDRTLWPAAAAIGALLLALQFASGAFQSEFTGHPDESAHFVSGLMIYDYRAAFPKANPISWAAQYYLHSPKVALGHWPPLFHIAEALWWLLFGPSRASALMLAWLIGVIALTMLYRLARSALSLPVSAAIVVLAIASPVFQQALEMTMTDLFGLLWSIRVMDATVRFIQI